MAIKSGKDQRLNTSGIGANSGTASILSGDQARDRQRVALREQARAMEDQQAHQLQTMGLEQDFQLGRDEARIQQQRELYQMKTDTEKQYIQDRSNEYQQKKKQIDDAVRNGTIKGKYVDDARKRLDKQYGEIADPWFSEATKEEEPMWTSPDGKTKIPLSPEGQKAYELHQKGEILRIKEQDKIQKDQQKEKMKSVDERIKAELYQKEMDPNSMEAFNYKESRRKELMGQQAGGPAQGEMGGTGMPGGGIAQGLPGPGEAPIAPAPSAVPEKGEFTQPVEGQPQSIYNEPISVENMNESGVRPGWVYKDYDTGRVIYPAGIAKAVEKKPVKTSDISPKGELKAGTNYAQLAAFMLMGDKFGTDQVSRDSFSGVYEQFGEAVRSKDLVGQRKLYAQMKPVIDAKLKENPQIFKKELANLERDKKASEELASSGKRLAGPKGISKKARAAALRYEDAVARRMKNLTEAETALNKVDPDAVRKKIEGEVSGRSGLKKPKKQSKLSSDSLAKNFRLE